MAENEDTKPEEDTPPPEEALAEDAAPADDAQAEAAAPAEPAEALTPKERRQRGRAAKAAKVPARGPTSPEERKAERDAARRRKAALRRTRRLRERDKARAARQGQPAPEPVAARPEVRPGTLKTRQGVVVSDRAAKTITVRIDVTRRHTRYQKIVRTSATLRAHDEKGEAHLGDTVVVRESRPLSRTKRWRLVEVVERAR